jgi:hypothetical protein
MGVHCMFVPLSCLVNRATSLDSRPEVFSHVQVSCCTSKTACCDAAVIGLHGVIFLLASNKISYSDGCG